jgi:peptidyl-prolyl cis-trans isomerase A (cyclophilin A)
MALVCPECQKLSPEGATRCDCGHAFVATSNGTKKCPSCAETILVDARKCRFCGEFLNPADAPVGAAKLSVPAHMPVTVKAAVSLLMISEVLAAIAMTLPGFKAALNAATAVGLPANFGVALGFVVFGFLTFFAVMFVLRQNWARIAFIVISLLGAPFSVIGVLLNPNLSGVVQTVLALGVLCLVVMPSSTEWFKGPRHSTARVSNKVGPTVALLVLPFIISMVVLELQSRSALNPLLSRIAPSSEITAPALFKAQFTTTKGDFVVEVHRDWAPLGADRFYNLVRGGFFTTSAFFRVVPNFMVQFGLSANPEVNTVWRDANLIDDPVKESNKRGYITFAKSGKPNSRTTQLFINFKDNEFLDSQGFAPFGIVVEGMDVVDRLYNGYGETQEAGGRGPSSGRIESEGDAYISKNFPNMDRIKSAKISAEVAEPLVSNQPQLELLKYAWHREYDFAILEGQVRNISSQPLRNVEALASFYDADGGFITSSDSLIEYNPILPGQTSPFKVMQSWNPAMKKAGVAFKDLMGGSIPLRDAETKRN